MTKIIVNKKFAEELSGLPREVQKKVTRIYGDLAKGNDASNGANLETIQCAASSSMKSMRVNDKYRIVVHRDAKGTYTFLHIDDHDKAYAWAARNRFGINPFTGEVQLYVVDIPEVKDVTASKRPPDEASTGPFSMHPNEADLLRLGVPTELIPTIRTLRDDEDILIHEKEIPQGVFDALLLLYDGKTPDEVVAELGLNKGGEVNENDVAAAVEKSDISQATFAFASSEEELNRIRDAAKMAAWRVFLHSTQRKHVVRQQNGPCKLLGGAGTGKTVVAMHRVKHLLEKVYVREDERILFTTFTKNLAEDIESLLGTICSEEQMKRVDVVNLDAWAMQYLRGQKIDVEVLSDDARKELIEKAIADAAPEKVRTAAFYLREREAVVLANEIDSFASYVRVSRAGSGVRLSAKEKKDVWEVLETYQRHLSSKRMMDREEVILLAVNLMRKGGGRSPYASVVVDEAQDFSATSMKLVALLSGNSAEAVRANSLFIVGDAHQRIYPRKTVLSRCGIRVQGRSDKLRLNYRTTEKIRRRAVAMLEGVAVDDLDGASDDNKGFLSMVVGIPPKEVRFKSFEKEMDAIVEQIKTWKDADARDASDYAILVRTNKDVESVVAACESRGVASRKVSTTTRTKGREDGAVRVATMHRAKGLEFAGVVIAEVNEGNWPLRTKDYDEMDPVSKKESDDGERSLLYVAITRAMKHAMIAGVGSTPKELGV